MKEISIVVGLVLMIGGGAMVLRTRTSRSLWYAVVFCIGGYMVLIPSLYSIWQLAKPWLD